MGNGGILVARIHKKVNNTNDLIVEDFSTKKWLKYSIMRK